MRSSLKLLTVRGIDIRLHITFPLILVWAALQFGLLAGNISSAIFGVVAISLLFILVTLHELGHSIAAQYYEIPVKQIILSPIGGVAQLSHIPEKPIQELIIAIAGPAVNLAVALLMSLILLTPLVGLSDPTLTLMGRSGFSLTGLFSYIFFYNILLALFNLIPAFPLDGGRIFRSLMAMRLDYVRATKIAALVGRIVAIGLGIFGILNGGFFLLFIAIFIFFGAGQEANIVQIRNTLRRYTVRDVYSASVYRLLPDSTVQQARNIMIFGKQRNFPIVVEDHLVGFISYSDFMKALPATVAHTRVSTIMTQNIRPVFCDDDLFLVQQRFIEDGTGALPVVDGDHFLGMVTQEQINNLQRQLSDSPKAVVQNQSA
jgi:Zn-dependent protease/predicted transcriptional regulator